MNESPASRWKRPLRGWARLIAWFVPLVGACVVVLGALDLTTEQNIPLSRRILLALLASAGLAALVLFIRWACCWRNFRRLLFGVACLITLIALAYAVENWRGHHAWQKHRREWEAKGEKIDLLALAPLPVPDDRNFALTPLLKPALDYTQGTNGTFPNDTNGLARLEKTRFIREVLVWSHEDQGV